MIVECVNPMALTRDSWLATAADVGAAVLEVEMICSDALEHHRRVLTRATDAQWSGEAHVEDVVGRTYEAWSRPHLIIDSADTPPEQAARTLAAHVSTVREARA